MMLSTTPKIPITRQDLEDQLVCHVSISQPFMSEAAPIYTAHVRHQMGDRIVWVEEGPNREHHEEALEDLDKLRTDILDSFEQVVVNKPLEGER